MTGCVMVAQRANVRAAFTGLKREHASKNGGKADTLYFREAGAGGSNPLSPTNFF